VGKWKLQREEGGAVQGTRKGRLQVMVFKKNWEGHLCIGEESSIAARPCGRKKHPLKMKKRAQKRKAECGGSWKGSGTENEKTGSDEQRRDHHRRFPKGGREERDSGFEGKGRGVLQITPVSAKKYQREEGMMLSRVTATNVMGGLGKGWELRKERKLLECDTAQTWKGRGVRYLNIPRSEVGLRKTRNGRGEKTSDSIP